MADLPPKQNAHNHGINSVGGNVIQLRRPLLVRKGSVVISRTHFKESRQPLIGIVLGATGLSSGSCDEFTQYHVLFDGGQYLRMNNYALQHDCLIVPRPRAEAVAAYRFESVVRLHQEYNFGRFDKAFAEAHKTIEEQCQFF